MKKYLTMMFALMLSLFVAIPVHAATYTPVAGTSTELTKYLVVDEDAEIPEAEFEFTVTAGSAQEATADTVKVWAGINPELVKVNTVAQTGTVEFVAGEEATPANAVTALGQENATGKKAAKKTIALDFSGVSFTEPGVYRYLVTETDPVAPISAVDSKVTTVDVYVEDVNGALVVQKYVAYEGSVGSTAPANSIDMSDWLAENPEPVKGQEETDEAFEARHAQWEADCAAEEARLLAEVPNGAEAGEKDDKFVNELATANIEFGKEVTGNQGSKDQYFMFTLTLGNLGNGTVLTLDMSEAENGVTHANTATSYAKADMDEANQRDDDAEKDGQQIIANASGAATITVYLHDGQYVTVKGLPEGATYSLTEENAAGYEKIEKITEAVNGTKAYEDEVSGTIGEKEGTTTPEYWTYGGEEFASLAEANAAAVDAGAEMPAEGEMATGVEYHEAVITEADQDIFTGYTNNREGVIPTGLIISAGAGIALVGLAGAGIYLSRRKREED